MTHRESLSHSEARLNRPFRPVLRDEDGRLPHESEFLRQLGDRVREMRALRGMSRRELARLSGLSERFVAQIEAGRGNVSIVRLLRISLVFRCDGPAASSLAHESWIASSLRFSPRNDGNGYSVIASEAKQSRALSLARN